MQRNMPRRGAFSMIEVLVVLGILALLLGFFIPVVQRVRVAAARTQSMNNLKQQAIGCLSFQNAFRKLPFNGTAAAFGDPATQGSGSWAYQILPFVGQQAAFQRPKNALGMPFRIFLNPARSRRGATTEGKFHGPVTDYAINTWLNDPKNGAIAAADRRTTFANITDGTSNTILVGELAVKPADYQANDAAEGRESFFFGGLLGSGRNQGKHVLDGPTSGTNQFGSPFSGGTQFGMCDASVRVIAFSVDVHPALTPDGGEVFKE